MGVEKLAQAAVAAVMISAATGQLPKLVREVQIAQFKLLKDSQESNWGRVMLITGRISKRLPDKRNSIRCLDGRTRPCYK